MLGFVDYEIENIAGITDVIYNEFIELCCFNSVMTDNTNDKIKERVNTWKDLLLKIVSDDTNYYVTKLDKKIEHFNFSPICHSCCEKIEILDESYCDLENAFYHISCHIKLYETPNKRLFSNKEIQKEISWVAMTISEEELEQLCNKKVSKEIFNLGVPLFIKCPKNISEKLKRDAVKDAKGRNRWTWDFEFERNNFLYAITTQWFQYNDIKVNEWLLNHK
jgi:hypothetical protein